MKLRLRCSNCRASFVVSGDPPPEIVECPECGKSHRLPANLVAPSPLPSALIEVLPSSEHPMAQESNSGVSVFVPSGQPSVEPTKPRGWRTYGAIAACLLILTGVLGSWPWLKERFWHPKPLDPVEQVAKSYLDALIREDHDEAQRLGTVEDPPAISSAGEVSRLKESSRTLRGKFGSIARLNKSIDAKFIYDPKIGRFTPKNPLGAAGETLDALHEAKEKAEKSKIYEKMASGDPNDLFDAAESYGKVFTQLAEGALAPKRILPTYSMLVKDAKPPLLNPEKELALDFGDNHAAWDALLKRSFLTLKADGPFILDRAEVNAKVRDKLASLGDPPSTLRLKLVRFRLEGIDTGWKITSAQRVSEPGEPNAVEPSPSPPESSHQREYDTNLINPEFSKPFDSAEETQESAKSGE